MRAYRWSINLKLGLVVFALLIVATSLFYTNRIANQLLARENATITLWAKALEELPKSQIPPPNPYRADLDALRSWLAAQASNPGASTNLPVNPARLLQALQWTEGLATTPEVPLTTQTILFEDFLVIPAIVIDSTEGGALNNWRNISRADSVTTAADSLRLRQLAQAWGEEYPPIPIEIDYGTGSLKQYVFYDASSLVKELRWYPYIQLLFVGLLIGVGYLGFSYVRRSEQRSLWVGMAKEAAHQLGTPISSLLGWNELLRLPELPEAQHSEALDEIAKDIQRLQRVANRFSDIGSLPKLKDQPLAPVIENTVDYIRRRVPQHGKRVELTASVDPSLGAKLNPELFEWVIENLLKNALDAIESKEGRIDLRAVAVGDRIHIDIQDTGKGIDRRHWSNVFRPGYSTKKRGWGLGLSLAKRIVEEYHGGQLTIVQSKLGEGTTFRIDLPLVPEASL